MPTLDERVAAIEQRNARVTYDKAWETSWVRRGMIVVITYAFGVILLHILGHQGAWREAFVPVMGYVLSTFSLPVVKKIWIERKEKKGHDECHNPLI